MEAGWMCDYNWRSDFQNDLGVTSPVQTSQVSSMKRRVPRLWTNVHQLDGMKPWTLLQPTQCLSGNSSATCSVSASRQSQGTLVLLQWLCSNRLWKLSRCVEGWLCFTQRTLYVFLTGGSNTFMKTPSERGRKAWMLQHLLPMSYMDTMLSASCKQSQRPPLMSVWHYGQFKRERKHSECWV